MSESMPPASNTPSVPANQAPTAPRFVGPDEAWEHFALYIAVRNALFSLPSFFKSDLVISGVLATDLFTFNSSLGATIEAQVVGQLNELRSVWDPAQRYTGYRFVRQSQQFPDVTLRASSSEADPQVLMGIELKGWYVLAKEQEPSFRYTVTPAVCAPQDLLVVYPWALSNVISGSPQLFQPYIVGARFAAEYRNWHWQYKREAKSNTAIRFSGVTRYYPEKTDAIADVPESDSGKNFGRFARTGLMDAYREQLFREELSGIPLAAWQRFLAMFNESRSEAEVITALDRMVLRTVKDRAVLTTQTIEAVKARLAEIVELLSGA